MDIINEKIVDMTFDEFCRGGKSITPGPWEASQAIRQGYTVYSQDRFIVGCEDEEGRYGAVRFAADARLIAAAPELLERAEADVKVMEEVASSINAIAPEAAAALRTVALNTRAAIAKAEGKT
jgi:hypothetical protein